MRKWLCYLEIIQFSRRQYKKEENVHMEKKNRIRYITCGVANQDEPISNFRLIAGCTFGYINACSALRVELPPDLKLIRSKWDRYSTTDDPRTLHQLGAVPVVKIDGRWKRMQELWPAYQPHKWYEVLRKRGLYATLSKRGYLSRAQYQTYLKEKEQET